MTTVQARTNAPLGRVLLAELRWVLRRPRNLFALLLVALIPVLLGTGIALTGGPSNGNGPPLLASVAGNGFVLPIAALLIGQTLLLPLIISMIAADAIAGESANGTLRGLLLAPVSRVRLVGIKASGVLVMVVLVVAVMAISGVLTGLVIVGADNLITLSGTTLPPSEAFARVALAAGWSMTQMAAVGAIALLVSSLTDHPLVVMATTMGMLILFGVFAGLPGLEWLQPFLVTTGWGSVMDVLRDPVVMDNMLTGLLRAGCYVLIGVSATIVRTVTRDA